MWYVTALRQSSLSTLPFFPPSALPGDPQTPDHAYIRKEWCYSSKVGIREILLLSYRIQTLTKPFCFFKNLPSSFPMSPCFGSFFAPMSWHSTHWQTHSNISRLYIHPPRNKWGLGEPHRAAGIVAGVRATPRTCAIGGHQALCSVGLRQHMPRGRKCPAWDTRHAHLRPFPGPHPTVWTKILPQLQWDSTRQGKLCNHRGTTKFFIQEDERSF